MDLPKLHPNERVDILDLGFVSDTNLAEARRTMRDLVVGDGVLRVVDGWGQSALFDDTTMRIERGAALAASAVNGDVTYGQLLSEGAEAQDIGFAGLGVGTWGVYIKFQYADGENGNRKFFDVLGNAEKTRMVKTRQVAGWIAVASQTSPGAEYLHLYDVAWDGAGLSTSIITDVRNFLFEGPADSAPGFSSSWGGGDDRDPDRAANGVKTIERFAAAVIKKIEELQSDSARWWEATVEPLDKKVSRFGDVTLTGNYTVTNGKLLLTGTGTGPALDILRAPGTGNPDPDTNDNHAIFQTTSSANGETVTAFFLHNGADLGRDGVVLYSKRIAEDDVDLRLGTIVDSAFGADKFTFDMSLGEFSAAGAIQAGTGLISLGGLPFTGLGLSVTNKGLFADDLEVDGDLDAQGTTTLALLAPTLMQSAGTDVAKNILDADLFVKAWAIIETDGAGNATIVKSKNINSVGVIAQVAGPPSTGGYVEVTLAAVTNIFTNEKWIAQAQSWNSADDGSSATTKPAPHIWGCAIRDGATSNRRVHVYAHDSSDPFNVDVDLFTTPAKFSVVIYGMQ